MGRVPLGSALLITLAALAAPVCRADSDASAAPTKAELIERLVKLDGTELQLNSLHIQMRQGIIPYGRKMPADDYALLQQSVDANFQGSLLFENYKEVMAGQISEEDLKAAISWFEQPLGRRLSQLQSESSSPEGVTEMRKFSAALAKNPPARSRDKLMKELDQTLKATDLLIDLAVNMAQGVAVGVLSVKDNPSRDEIDAARERLVQMRGEMRKSLGRNTYVNNLFTYRGVSDSDLRAFIEFFKSKAGHNVIEASFFALNDSLQKASEEVGKEVGRLRRIKADSAARAQASEKE